MKKTFVALAIGLLLWSLQGHASAHFGMVIPEDSMIIQGDTRIVRIISAFSHPMEMVGMNPSLFRQHDLFHK